MYGGVGAASSTPRNAAAKASPLNPSDLAGSAPLWEGRLFAASLRDIFIVAYLSCRGKKKERNGVFLSFLLRVALFR